MTSHWILRFLRQLTRWNVVTHSLRPIFICSAFLFLVTPCIWGENETNRASEVEITMLDRQLMDLGSLQFYTASKSWTPIDKVPSIVSVITEEDMEVAGYKNLKEVLDRVPGFFNPAPSESIASVNGRGLFHAANNNYLLLIDGHAQTMSSYLGIMRQTLYPFLYNVERIEIIRGPSSTLWGGEANLGVIHIFTKSGNDIVRETGHPVSVKTYYDYQIRDNRSTYGFMLGSAMNEKTDFLVSYTQTHSDLFIHEGNSYRFPAVTVEDITRSWPRSHDLQFNANAANFRVAGRWTQQNIESPTDDDKSYYENSFDQKWINLSYTLNVADQWDLDSRLLYDHTTETYDELFFIAGNPVTPIEVYQEEGFGGEMQLRFSGEDHNALTGVRYYQRLMGPSYQYADFGFFVLENDYHETLREHELSWFIEDSYSGIDNWIFTIGNRIDYNDTRAKGVAFLPRAAAVYSFSDNWTAKYAFSTGQVRPSMRSYQGRNARQELARGPSVYTALGAEKSPTTYSHDLQLIHSDGPNSESINFFYIIVKDQIQKIGLGTPNTSTNINGMIYDQVYDNIGTVQSYGVEFEFNRELVESLAVYGNCSYAHAKLDDTLARMSVGGQEYDFRSSNWVTENNTMTSTPVYMWGLGLNWFPIKNLSLNLHYRGWHQIWTPTEVAGEFDAWGPEHYLDFNLVYRNILKRNIELSVYGRNVLDNTNLLPMFTGNENSRDRGAVCGVQIMAQF